MVDIKSRFHFHHNIEELLLENVIPNCRQLIQLEQPSHSLMAQIVLKNCISTCLPETLKYWVGVQWGQSYLMGEGASLALVGPVGWCTPSFAIGLVKMVSGFIVRSVESGLGR